jgi:diadenosine tetraphosphatase ApaH/serine/threonine PP2A family protein phosphatase
LNDEAYIQSQLAPVSQTIILCGHSHVPRLVQLSDGRMVINPGSVGLPAYADDKPLAHKMENGSPHARYTLLTGETTGWGVEQISVPYEWEKAAEKAKRNGRNDWAIWLESGRA